MENITESMVNLAKDHCMAIKWIYSIIHKVTSLTVPGCSMNLLGTIPENLLQHYSQSCQPHSSWPFHDFAWYNSSNSHKLLMELPAGMGLWGHSNWENAWLVALLSPEWGWQLEVSEGHFNHWQNAGWWFCELHCYSAIHKATRIMVPDHSMIWLVLFHHSTVPLKNVP